MTIYKNFSEIQENKLRLEKELQDTEKLLSSYSKDLSIAISQNDIVKIKEIFSFGFDIDESEIENIKKIQSSFSNKNLELELVNLFILDAPKKIKKMFSKFYFNSINNALKSTSFDNLFFADHLEFIYTNLPIFFNSISNNILERWGTIPYDPTKHIKLCEFIEKSIQVGTKISHKQIFINSSKSINELINNEVLYADPVFQQWLDKLIKKDFEKFKELANLCMSQAISKGSIHNMNFWTSFYIKFPIDKSPYSELIQTYKYKNFSEVIDSILQNTSIAVADNIMLRTAFHYNNEEKIKILLSKYNPEQLLHFNNKYGKQLEQKKLINNDIKELINKTLNYHHLDQVLNKDNHKTSHKKTKI